jgi:uncharacterized protein (TIGR00251 family)
MKLGQSRDGILLQVRARPRARRNAIDGVRDGALLISVTAAPEDGCANAAILKVLSDALGCAQSTLSIERGQTARDKTVLVPALSLEEVTARLASKL